MATVNNNWPTPVATDLVKDGWEAIKDLGDAIDTTLGVYADPGLVLLNTTSFSAVSSVSFPNDIFTSTYDNYFMTLNITGRSTSLTVSIRFRTSGSDDTGANYGYITENFGSGGAGNLVVINNSAATSIPIDTAASSSRKNFLSGSVFNPKLSQSTNLYLFGANSTTVHNRAVVTGSVVNTTVYDSLSVLADTGNITGSMSVFGVAN
jgi:hypothetical protein